MLASLGPCIVFWFLTAPAGMALERIASGGNGGPFARAVGAAFDWYQAPMVCACKIPSLRRMSDSLEDWWCEVLAAPETTP